MAVRCAEEDLQAVDTMYARQSLEKHGYNPPRSIHHHPGKIIGTVRVVGEWLGGRIEKRKPNDRHKYAKLCWVFPDFWTYWCHEDWGRPPRFCSKGAHSWSLLERMPEIKGAKVHPDGVELPPENRRKNNPKFWPVADTPPRRTLAEAAAILAIREVDPREMTDQPYPMIPISTTNAQEADENRAYREAKRIAEREARDVR